MKTAKTVLIQSSGNIGSQKESSINLYMCLYRGHYYICAVVNLCVLIAACIGSLCDR